MLINHVVGEECRIALVEDGKLEELYQARASTESHVGNIYKGKVVNVEPAIQAAFIDFGLERNGFLHITDLHPRYFPGNHREETERVGHKTPHRTRPPIQHCLKRGQDILVQVIKEGIGTKGPTLTSYLSIPGRFIVMMPHMERLGVSRKVEDHEQRHQMRKLLDELDPPDGFGFIIRTAGFGRSKTDLKRDLSYLQRLWKAIDQRMQQPGIGELYVESDLVIRTIRDVFSTDIERIIVDEPTAAARASDFLSIASPRARSSVLFYNDPIPLFDRYGVEEQIETIHSRHVPLPSGGSLVIDATEALVAIDVNSGRMRQHKDSETTAFKTNQEACDEVCRQLRLRDLGGVVVIDLIDMRDAKRRRAIEQRFRDNLKKDRARTKPLAISQFGILEMTRQRMRPSLKRSLYTDCAACNGTGHVKSVESVVLDTMRRLALCCHREDVARVRVLVSADVAAHLLNRKRRDLVRLEETFETIVAIEVRPQGTFDQVEFEAFDERNNPISLDAPRKFGKPDLVPVESIEQALEDQTDADGEAEPQEAGGAEEAAKEPAADPASGEAAPKRRRRRRGGRRRKKKSTGESAAEAGPEPGDAAADQDDEDADDASQPDAAPKKKRRRRRRKKSASAGEPVQSGGQ